MKFQATPSKQVLLYSTKHRGREIHSSGKPQIIEDYNATKFGVDIFDEMSNRYAYAPPTRRWPLRLFMHLCDAAGVNAYILFKGSLTRREFIHQLADELMDAQRQRRAETSGYANATFQQISELYKRYTNSWKHQKIPFLAFMKRLRKEAANDSQTSIAKLKNAKIRVAERKFAAAVHVRSLFAKSILRC